VNSHRPILIASFSDPSRGELDAAGVRVLVDGMDVTSSAAVDVPWGPNPQGLQGRWTGTATYRPAQDLGEGPHTVTVVVADVAGNIAEITKTIVVDTLAPALVLDGPPVRFTRLATAVVSGRTEPGATVSIGAASSLAPADGTFAFTVNLTERRNEFVVQASDWFHLDPLGDLLAGNSAQVSMTIIRDIRAPTILVTAPASPTASDVVLLRGRVTESISATEGYDPATVVLTVGGRRAWVQADGSFSVALPLSEGANAFTVVAMDLAGNSASVPVAVTRDSMAPTLQVLAIPAETTSGSLNVSGRTDPGALVFINGIVVRPAADGSFYRVVALSGGPNVIVVRAEDLAGNAVEQTFPVAYVAGSGGSSLGAWAGVGVLIAILAALGTAFLFGRDLVPWSRRREEEGPQPPGEPTSEEENPPGEAEAPPPAESPAEPPSEVAPSIPSPSTPSVDDRVSKIESAFAAGRIGREAYARNLRALGREPPPEVPEPEPPAPQPSTAERVDRLRAAFEQGRITREAYESNLTKLGMAAAAPPAPSSDERVAPLESAFREGRITEDAYRANLARLGLGVSSEEPPAPPSDKAVALENAYREGRISRAMYEANLARLGLPAPATPEDRGAALRRAFEAGRIAPATYAQNLVRMLGVADDPRAETLRSAFTEGRIDADLLEKNLRRLRQG